MAITTAKNTAYQVNKIFNDLDDYRNFCRDYGYRFNEADLYSQKNYVYRQFQKFISGKPVKNQWEADLARIKEHRVSARRV
jgi:hypothetical protein